MQIREIQHPRWRLWRWLGWAAIPFTILSLSLSFDGVSALLAVSMVIPTTLWTLYALAVRANLRHIGNTLKRGQCLECGYDLRGSVAGGAADCPECGERIHSGVRRHLEGAGMIKASTRPPPV